MSPPPHAASSETDERARVTYNLYARAYAMCALCIGTAAVFFLTGVAPLPVLRYFPISRRFSFSASATELSMDYYGRSLLALLAGLTLALSTSAVLRVVRRKQARAAASAEIACTSTQEQCAPARPLLLLFTAHAATALLLAIGLFAYQLWVRVPTPESLLAPAPQGSAEPHASPEP